MIKNIVLFIALISVLAFWTKSIKAQFGPLDANDIQKPVVIELFTSQSCSSCPPADRNLAALSENPNIIALSFHVTYWDHLHWKDTLSQPFSTDRQRSYAAYKRNGRVYTPQMIVNGEEEFVGSRGGDITRALKQATTIKLIKVSKENSTSLTATLPELPNGNYTLWVAGIQNEHTQAIPSGENRGKTVIYKNTVITLDNGGKWDGKSQNLTLEIEQSDDSDHYVVFAQKDKYGQIIAAGKS